MRLCVDVPDGLIRVSNDDHVVFGKTDRDPGLNIGGRGDRVVRKRWRTLVCDHRVDIHVDQTVDYRTVGYPNDIAAR
jgi:hypothetical protein